MASVLDVCRFVPTAGGTTDWTYSSAVQGYQSPTAAGVVNGSTYRYRAESADLSQWEVGYGTYNTGTGVLARTTVLFNSSGTTSKISFSVAPNVAIVLLKEDLISIDEANSFTVAQQDRARSNIGASAGYPDFWNGSFSVWQRATSFSFTGGTQTPNYGQYTADYCSNGAGSGGVCTVQKYTLNAIEQAAITPAINPPSTGMRMTWTTAPTSGGGQTGYTAYASYIELKGNNVPNYAGKQVTVSCWIRCATGQTLPFYLYVALGGLTSSGSASNTISGTGAGVDYTSAGSTEIFARSARQTTATGPTWQRFSYTLTLDNLQAATFTSANTVVNIGIGMDYTDVSLTSDIYVTAMGLDVGPAVLPWREWPDEMKYAFALYNFQRIGLGSVGYVLNATTVRLSVMMKGVIKANGAGGAGLGTTPSTNPTVVFSNGTSASGSGSAIAGSTTSANGMLVDINGFSGLTAGLTAILVTDWLYTAQG